MKKSDLTAVKHIVDNNQMFPSEYLDEMTSGYFNKKSEELWFVVQADDQLLAVAFCAPERMTAGTWNLLLIAVLKTHQGQGIGAQLMAFVEAKLRSLTARVLLVETSGMPEYQLTRAFYPQCGYQQVAVIPEFYDIGDDKVVFWKSLTK
ncbi:hypothetical protein SD53_04435 [Rheinheimera mesophila]|nr:hypothetical protein SD53_04435 [Rheinheimera mesophila]